LLRSRSATDPYRLGGAIASAVFNIPVESSAIDAFVDQLKQMAAVVGHTARLTGGI